MMDAHALPRTTRRRGLILFVTAGVAAFMCGVWVGERNRTDMKQEVRWLEQRLGEKRAVNARQRQEMAEVANAVDRLTRAANAVRERATEVRRAARMEESREGNYEVTAIRATFDDGRSILSEDAARALAGLSWVEAQNAAVGDSLAMLTAVMKERPLDLRPAMPGIWPVRGQVTSRFGRRQSPWGDGLEMHPGIDISASLGKSVTAGADGRVIFAGREPGYGALVVIDHGGDLDTYYGHLSALYVREGQSVRRGQPIGAVGATGRATGAHLHYEVRVHGTPVDPQRYLD